MRHTGLDQLFRAVLFTLLAALFFGGVEDGVANASGFPGPNPDHIDPGNSNANDLRLSNSAYVLGKSIYYGRSKGKLPELKVCLSVYDEETDAPKAVSLSRKLLRPFRERHITSLTSRLVDCEAPTSQVALILDRTEFRALIYFMNKKFRLRLES